MERSNSLVASSKLQQLDEGSDFNLKEWGLRARRENTNSRRFSASNLKSFREEARSSNITISSTTSSPGYTLREEIDPSTYSFTTALKALQAKTVYTWEFRSPENARMTLNSKWNEAEKYICNPLSGEVPLECLSAKTLSGRSFRGLASRITMSAPLIYPSHMHQFNANTPIHEHEPQPEPPDTTPNEKKRSATRDVGTQSTPVELSSPTPSIEERSIKVMIDEAELIADDSSGNYFKSDTEGEEKERGERKKQQMQRQRMSNAQWGCLSLRGLWMSMRTVKHKHKPTTNKTNHAFQLSSPSQSQ